MIDEKLIAIALQLQVATGTLRGIAPTKCDAAIAAAVARHETLLECARDYSLAIRGRMQKDLQLENSMFKFVTMLVNAMAIDAHRKRHRVSAVRDNPGVPKKFLTGEG
ncbi:hypothetical protein F4859DRAFT_512533 [Xylaria cf. heliscus]|nr:hypothetical protein F4859DRAFT_512533 [Xylaria cf. heliscus]